MNTEYDRWESRFAVQDYVFGTRPSAFLESCKALLPAKGKALAIADGEGRNGVWLAQQGLEVTSIEFSPSAQEKAKRLAKSVGVTMNFELADVHTWSYPLETFDVVADIFTQFSTPTQRPVKFSSIRKTLKSGGLLILQGYVPKQLDYGTGGPKDVAHLYTREMLEAEFTSLRNLVITEQEAVLDEGTAHSGKSAFIGLTGNKA